LNTLKKIKKDSKYESFNNEMKTKHKKNGRVEKEKEMSKSNLTKIKKNN